MSHVSTRRFLFAALSAVALYAGIALLAVPIAAHADTNWITGTGLAVSSPNGTMCNVTYTSASDDHSTGLAYGSTAAPVTIAGANVISCIDVDFGSSQSVAALRVDYSMPNSICGDSCSGAYCGTDPGSSVFASTDRSTWTRLGGLSFSVANATQQFSPTAPLRYVRICRGTGGSARNNLAIDYVAIQPVVMTLSSCTFDGKTIQNGSSVTAYQAATVSTGSTCVSQTRTCTNGTLSGTYTNTYCFVKLSSDWIGGTPLSVSTPPLQENSCNVSDAATQDGGTRDTTF